MSDSKMFTNNKMPEGYDEVWKRFGQHWCGETEEPKKIWIGKRGKPLAPFKDHNAEHRRRMAEKEGKLVS